MNILSPGEKLLAAVLTYGIRWWHCHGHFFSTGVPGVLSSTSYHWHYRWSFFPANDSCSLRTIWAPDQDEIRVILSRTLATNGVDWELISQLNWNRYSNYSRYWLLTRFICAPDHLTRSLLVLVYTTGCINLFLIHSSNKLLMTTRVLASDTSNAYY